MCHSNLITLAALAVALITAIIQIRIQYREWRPYLSFTGMNGIVKIFIDTGLAGIDFILNLKNVGKCVLYYNVIQFDIFINGVKAPDVELSSEGSVIGVNSDATYSKFFNGILQYKVGLAPEQYTPPNHKIIFTIEYYRADKQRKKYKLSYEMSFEVENGVQRMFYGKTFAN